MKQEIPSQAILRNVPDSIENPLMLPQRMNPKPFSSGKRLCVWALKENLQLAMILHTCNHHVPLIQNVTMNLARSIKFPDKYEKPCR